jgi:hypothetical protein
MFDTVHDLEQLRQMYPNPPRELLCDGNLVHHAYAFGEPVIVIEAVKECLAIARAKADTGAIAHLSKHIKEYGTWKEQQQMLDMAEKGRGAKNVLPLSVGVR